MKKETRIRSIVLVDDEEDVLSALERDIREWTRRRGLTVYTVQSGEECMRIVHEEYPAIGLVVSDLRMPGMNGADLFSELHTSFPDIGCILVTAYSDMEQITRAVSASMLGLVQKPWNPSKITEDLDHALDHVQLQRSATERNHELTEQLKMAGAFQRVAVATSVPPDDRIEFGFLSRPAKEMYVTGDFSDLLQLDNDRYMLLVGDVAGHGVRAALLSAMLKIVVRTYMKRVDGGLQGPAAILNTFSNHIDEYIPQNLGMIASCATAVVDLNQKTVVVANAGHPPAFVVSNQDYHYSSVLNPALGVDANTHYDEETLPFEPGNRLVLFSDGLYSSSGDSDKQFSATRIGTILQGANRSMQFEENVVRLTTADRILHGRPTVPLFTDDLTLASLRYR